MASFSVYPDIHAGTPCAYEDLYNKIRKENFTIRTDLEQNRKENTLIKKKYNDQTEELRKSNEENLKLATQTKSNLAKLEEQKIEIANLGSVVSSQGKELNECKQKLEENQKKNKKLTRKISETEDQVQNLERNIEQKRCKIKEKNSKIETLEKKLASERDKCSKEEKESERLRNKLKKVKAQLKSAEEAVSEKEKKIQASHSVISEIEDLKGEVKSLKEQDACHRAFIQNQSAYIKELESRAEISEDALEENKNLMEQLEQAEKRITDTTETFKQQQQAVLEALASKARLEKENVRLEITVQHHQQFQEEREKFVTFVKEIATFVEFGESENTPLVNQLDILAETIKSMTEMNQKFCEVMDGVMKVRQGPSVPNSRDLPVPSLTTSQLVPQSVAVVLPSVPETTSQALCDPLFNDIMINITSSLPQHGSRKRESALKKIKKTSKKKRSAAHGEDVKKRFIGRGKGSRGAKFFCQCGFSCRSFTILRCHFEQQSQERNLKCQICPKRFLMFGHLKRHLIGVHFIGNALSNFKGGCRSCGFLYESTEEYKGHTCQAQKNPDKMEVDGDEGSGESTAVEETPPPSPSAHLPIESTRVNITPDGELTDEEVDVEAVECIDLTEDDANNSSLYGDRTGDTGFNLPHKADFSDTGNATISGQSDFHTQHRLDPSSNTENTCLCGIPFATAEKLKRHIEYRSSF